MLFYVMNYMEDYKNKDILVYDLEDFFESGGEKGSQVA